MTETEYSTVNSYVQFKNVQKSYDGKTLIVKNLNLSVKQGEFFTLLGNPRVGKTTCLMMLAGFEKATDGEIFLDGVPMNNVSPYKREIGIVFKRYALFPHLTVNENLAFPLRIRKLSSAQIKERVTQALDAVQLNKFGNRKAGQLSDEQQTCVQIARVLAVKPKLALMDEPLDHLDKRLKQQMQYVIKSIHEHLRVTVIYITHDQSQALTMSNRIAVFNDGVIQQLASPSVLYEQPDNSFVAQFIGENNFLQGEIARVDKNLCEVKLTNGEIVKAKAVNINGIGSATTLSLRPERVTVNPELGSCANEFQTSVKELVYFGDYVRISVSLCGNDDFIIKIPNTSGYVSLENGQPISVGWQSVDCRALDPFG